MVIPFLSVYLTSQLGFTKTGSAIVLSAFGIGALIGSNVGGYLTDRIGNFKVMAISLFTTAIGFFGILCFDTLVSLSIWLFFTAIFSSMFSSAAFSAVPIWGNPENETRGYSLLRMAINLGIAIGPAIGGFLAYSVGYHWLFIIDGVTCIFAGIALYLFLAHKKDVQIKPPSIDVKSQSPYTDKIALLFLFFNLLNMIAFFQILFAVPVYFKEHLMMSEYIIGVFLTVNGILVFAMEMPVVYKIEQANTFIKPMVWGAFLIGLAYLCLGAIPHVTTAIVLFSIFIAVGEVINFPLIPTLVMRRANDDNQGQYMGLVTMMFALAFSISPVSGLPIIEYTGYQVYWFIAAAFSMLSAICLWWIRHHLEDPHKTET